MTAWWGLKFVVNSLRLILCSTEKIDLLKIKTEIYVNFETIFLQKTRMSTIMRFYNCVVLVLALGTFLFRAFFCKMLMLAPPHEMDLMERFGGGASHEISLRLLLKESTISQDVFQKLQQIDMDDIDVFLSISDQDLTHFCDDPSLDLSVIDKIKFKRAIRKIQRDQSHQSPQIRVPQVIIPSDSEHNELRRIQSVHQQYDRMHHLFHRRLLDMEEHVKSVRFQINNTFHSIRSGLQKRLHIISQELEHWESIQRNELQSVLRNIYRDKALLNVTWTKCMEMLSNPKRDRLRIKQIVDSFFEGGDGADMNAVYEFMDHQDISIMIRFPTSIDVHDLDSFGTLSVENGDESSFREVIHSVDDRVLRTIFVPDDDPRNNWLFILPLNDTQMAMMLGLLLSLFCIYGHCNNSMNQDSPIEIPLVVHSHNGHSDDRAPDHMLNADRSFYFSRDSVTRNDWIVFSMRNQNTTSRRICSLRWMEEPTKLFYPTRLELVTTICHWSARQFVLYIGSSFLDEWIPLHDIQSGPLVAQRSDEVQQFRLSMDHSKYTLIRDRRYRQIKLFILDNHGNKYYIAIRRMQLFGLVI